MKRIYRAAALLRRGACIPAPLAMTALAASFGVPAHAGTIDLGDGMEAIWSLNASLTSGWRASNPDPELVGIGDGGNASAYTGSATRNFKKGDNFTTLFRIVGDVNLRKGDTGVFVRAKAWDNYRLSKQSVPFGAPTNGFTPDTRLDDSEFDTNLSKFKGVELLDAYVYSGFDIGDDVQAKIKLGNHAVNFGESLFVPGVNQYSVFDVNALRQPGTFLKEAILPVPQISGSVGLPGNVSAEAFYQFRWKPTSIDGCGTYWSPATALNCTNGKALVASDAAGSFTSFQYANGVPALGGLNFNVSRRPDREPSNNGQYGFTLKKNVESIDTEFGAYFVNYATHIPYLSAVRDLNTVPNSIYYAAAPLGSIYWDYSARNIKVAGLSASTVLGGWAVAGEVSYTKDFPVQVSPVDLFLSFAAPNGAGGVGVGPLASRYGSTAAPIGSGTDLSGYDLKNKTQVQASTIKILSNVLGASSVTLVGEVAAQHWSGIGDPYTSVRYGRSFEYGAAQHASLGGACATTNAANCTQDGYYTSNAWGYRLLAELEYPGLITGINLKPRLFFSHDVKGWSADGMFSQNRRIVSVGVRAEYAKRYYIDLSYTNFNANARFDSFHDRDFYGMVLGASF
ncbi:MAG TPA: DUF1302 domain-containing protein [Noviherbaspirillum sp.]|nr:DUF1302 domain-containing protein [Noviherbaspirillum sp.]